MEKRYQVFISSTYTDLVEERSEVMQALLELECMPAGMELFPASNETQWNWIKKVIDESDYYIVIVGGRYGSINPKLDISYTEMEYRYALEINKPIIGFLHEKPNLISKQHSEISPEKNEKLKRFRDLVQSKLCKFYSNPSDLGAKVSRSITQLKKQYPAIGWVRANSIKSTVTEEEYLKLIKKNEELENRIHELGENEITMSKSYSSGSDEIIVTLSCNHRQRNPENHRSWLKQSDKSVEVSTTWDIIFINLAPNVLTAEKHNLFGQTVRKLKEQALVKLFKKYDENDNKFEYFGINNENRILQQFRVLGLLSINEDDKWVLTKYGLNYFNKLIAIPKGFKKLISS